MATKNIKAEKPVDDDVLQCPLCLHPLENPITLQQCLHTYCKECLNEIPQTSKDDVTGWMCPKCNRFTSAEDVKKNDFIEKVIMYEKVDDKVKDPMTCKQCYSKTDVNWWCSDCRIELCSPCQVIHSNPPMFKSHKVTPLDGITESCNAIDELLFCQHHKERLIELNCKMCEIPLCLHCKMEDHDTHTSETVTHALKRLVPEIEQKSEIIATKMQHLEAKVNVIRIKMEETKKCYAETREKVHERIEYLIADLRRLENEQVEILKVEEIAALTALEKIKLELEHEIEGSKHLINMAALTLQSSRDTSLLKQLEDGLLQKVRDSSEKPSEPLLIDVPYHALTFETKAGECQAKLTSIYGKLNKIDMKCKTSREGQLLDNHYLCHNIFQIVGKPTCTVDLPMRCDRLSLIDGHIFATMNQWITVYDLGGNLTSQLKVPFYSTVIKKLPNGQLAVGSLEGLHLYNCLKPDVDAFQLADGEYSDMNVFGDVFHALKCDTVEILTFAYCKDKAQSTKHSWFKESTVKLKFISKPHNCDTFCRSDDIFIVSSTEDSCVFLCDLKGNFMTKLMERRESYICGLEYNENVIIADCKGKKLHSYDIKENSQKQMSVFQLPGKPCDLSVDPFGSMWVLLEEQKADSENCKLAKFDPNMF